MSKLYKFCKKCNGAGEVFVFGHDCWGVVRCTSAKCKHCGGDGIKFTKKGLKKIKKELGYSEIS